MADKPRVKDIKNSGKVQPGDIYNYLTKDKGVSHNHALGMIANMNAESNFNPLIEEKPGTGKGGIGLFQHTGPRRTALLNHVNGNLSNWQKQIDFALTEGVSKKYLAETFNQPEAAVVYFMKEWENPKDQSEAKQKERVEYLSEFGNGIYATPGYQVSGDASTFKYDYNSNPLITDVEHFNIVNSQDYSVKAASFKEALAVEKEKEKKVETEPETQELTAAQKEYNNRVSFLNTFNQTEDEVPKQVAVDETQSSPINPNLYAANTNIEIADQTTPLFSTTLNLPETTQEFGDGGRKQSLADLTIGEEYHYQDRPNKSYKLTDKGTWLIKDTKSKDGWKPIVDPTGERAATLERTVIPKEEYFRERQAAIKKDLDLIKKQDNPFYLEDARKVLATNGQPIRPNSDLKNGEYSEDVVKYIITKARANGVDPKLALAVGLQESLLGKSDTNLGHNLYGDEDPAGYIPFLKAKIDEAKRAGHTDEKMQIQYYNGTGKIGRNTEKSFDGTKSKYYGVSIPAEGIDLSKNPLYGKQILDLKDNVIDTSPFIDSLLNLKKFGGGGKATVPILSNLLDQNNINEFKQKYGL